MYDTVNKGFASRLSREQFITDEDYRKVAIKRILDAERIIII